MLWIEDPSKAEGMSCKTGYKIFILMYIQSWTQFCCWFLVFNDMGTRRHCSLDPLVYACPLVTFLWVWQDPKLLYKSKYWVLSLIMCKFPKCILLTNFWFCIADWLRSILVDSDRNTNAILANSVPLQRSSRADKTAN